MKNTPAKILIVEDEWIIASDIEMTLESMGYKVTGIAANAADAMESIGNNPPDLILLDIRLEDDTDGVMLANDINKLYRIPFIYLTSNADPMTINRVKRTYPAGFIVKPFSEKELQSNIEIALFNRKISNSPSMSGDSFFIKHGNSLVKINIKDLLFVQADDNYSKIVTRKQEYLVSMTLKKVVEKVNSDKFVRIHRSNYVNIAHIDSIQDNYVIIGKHKLPIGRSYHNDFFNRINKL